MNEKVQKQMIPKYIIVFLNILILGMISQCSSAQHREQPIFEVSLVYPDGQPAVGVSARVVQIIINNEGKQGRYYPDKNNQHWWQDAVLGISKMSQPCDQNGHIILQGASVRKQDEYHFAIRDIEPLEQAAYQIQWSGGMAAPLKNMGLLNNLWVYNWGSAQWH